MAIGANKATLSLCPRSCMDITRLYRREAASAGERLLISGGCPEAGGVGADSERAAPKRWPATSATSATNAIPATAQGRALLPLLTDLALATAGVPHRWQNLAPGVSNAPHSA